jgi:hypothetical protein
MKRPLTEQEMLEILELAKIAGQKARETGEFATELALKYRKRVQKIREAQKVKIAE